MHRFHFYAHDMNRQVEAHHYCTHYNQDVRQCLIYDSPEKNARLIGVEYIVSEKLFQGLPDEEKKLWHTHEYEVKGGILFLPGVPTVAEVKELDEVWVFFVQSAASRFSIAIAYLLNVSLFHISNCPSGARDTDLSF